MAKKSKTEVEKNLLKIRLTDALMAFLDLFDYDPDIVRESLHDVLIQNYLSAGLTTEDVDKILDEVAENFDAEGYR